MSREETLLQAYIEGKDVSEFKCRSRVETLLKRICCGESCDDFKPRSRIEYLLVELSKCSGSGATIPSVLNIVVSEFGVLTFDEPDYTALAEYDPTISYLVNVNGNEFETLANTYDIFNYLVEGENSISVKVKALLRQVGDNKETVIEYSIPVYTPINQFTLEATTVNGESGYKITGYNGSETEINIPLTNTDGSPILECNSLNVSKITGNSIKNIGSFQGNNNIIEVNFPNTTALTSLNDIFRNATNLIDLRLNTSNVTSMAYAFVACKFTTAPQMNTQKLQNMTYAFYGCKSLETIPEYDLSNLTGINALQETFTRCSKLKSFLAYGMRVSFDISASTEFEREDLVTILNNLGTVTSTKTLTMGSTNLAKLTEDDKLIATNKGWTLA